MTPEQFKKTAMPWINRAVKRNIDIDVLIGGLHRRTEFLEDIPPQIDFIDELPQYDAELYRSKKMKTNPENSLEALKELLPFLENVEEWDHESLYYKTVELSEKTGVNKKKYLWSLRVAVSGKMLTPGGGTDIAAVLGKDESISRIKKGIEILTNYGGENE
jgi:glutamyl-tRNA synthetase